MSAKSFDRRINGQKVSKEQEPERRGLIQTRRKPQIETDVS
jgi:hypothetical protein